MFENFSDVFYLDT